MTKPGELALPSILPMLAIEDLSPSLSAAQLIYQLQLSSLNQETACNIMQSLGFEAIGYGNEEENIWLPYFSSPSIIRRTSEVQESFPNKFMKILSCRPSDVNTTNEYQVSLPTSHEYGIKNSPYSKRLSVDCYAGLDKSHINILNLTWNKRSHMKLTSF